ncbi:MAG: shikimate dehydrogenase [Acidobacteria bacterium]|nr:shikimate dehydrogenase [Acidobacteriota bacterium]
MISLRSLPRVCVALGDPSAEVMERLALKGLEQGQRFFELRLDMLQEPAVGIDLLRRLSQIRPRPTLLATCRRREARGEYDGTIEEQNVLLLAAAAAGAQLVDVEIETAEPAPEVVERLRQDARVVLSFHDFDGCPDLEAALERLRKAPADIYKLAVTARRPTDILRLLELLDRHPDTPLALMAMGEIGAPSRVLTAAWGGKFSFAAPDGAAGTAPGQLTATTVRDLYQLARRTRRSKVYGVIADPVAHSLSPQLHNRALRRKRMDACYFPFRVSADQLDDFFELAEGLPIEGFSVTIPHKEAVLSRLAGVDPLAQRIGAVNTVYRKDGKLWGANTDVVGVVVPLEKRLKLAGARVLVAGTGGAARAAVFALADRGATVVLAGRNPVKTKALADEAGVGAATLEQVATASFDALVHTTPVGMSPNIQQSLFPNRIPADLVFDMVYNPLETALLRRAAGQGKQTIEGLEMFLEQAAAQFELWTGARAPRTTMRNAVLEVLQGGPTV